MLLSFETPVLLTNEHWSARLRRLSRVTAQISPEPMVAMTLGDGFEICVERSRNPINPATFGAIDSNNGHINAVGVWSRFHPPPKTRGPFVSAVHLAERDAVRVVADRTYIELTVCRRVVELRRLLQHRFPASETLIRREAAERVRVSRDSPGQRLGGLADRLYGGSAIPTTPCAAGECLFPPALTQGSAGSQGSVPRSDSLGEEGCLELGVCGERGGNTPRTPRTPRQAGPSRRLARPGRRAGDNPRHSGTLRTPFTDDFTDAVKRTALRAPPGTGSRLSPSPPPSGLNSACRRTAHPPSRSKHGRSSISSPACERLP